MGFSLEEGYIPLTVNEIMEFFREGINAEFGTAYTQESFEGTNFYKFFYRIAQRCQGNEVKTAEIFLKLQQYIALTNERIQRPTVSYPGLIDSFKSKGYIASLKKNDIEDAGTVSICVDVDDKAEDYEAKKLEINTLIKDFVVGGMVSLGTETSEITLSNGQAFNFSYFLPNRLETYLRLSIVVSDNNLLTIPGDEELRSKLIGNIFARYRLGWDFEPQKYFSTADAPWAASIKLEYSHDEGVTWEDEVFQADFQDLFEFSLANTQVIVS